MKKLILFLILFCSLSVLAQDKIYLKNGEKINAKILKVTEEKIEYKKFSNLEGPTFEISVNKIQLVVYQNGESQMFNTNINNNNNIIQNEISTFANKNRINLDLLAYSLNGPTSISYEILNKNGSLGIEIPINVLFNSGGVSGIMTGTNLKFYVDNNARGFYIGPALGVGIGNFSYLSTSNLNYLGAYLGPKLGIQYQISQLFGINLSGTGGLISSFSYFSPTLFFSFNLGLNFSF
ncbi:MAG: hypothetical protein WCG08_09190 [Paludibacter sp.]